MRILSINHGSSSLKFALISIEKKKEKTLQEGRCHPKELFSLINGIDAVGHRIVHGGKKHLAPEIITKRLLRSLESLSPFAPLHLPIQIKAIQTIVDRYPKLRQIACFDTAFHKDLPLHSKMLPLPRKYYKKGVQKYGFHGLSYEYIVSSIRPNKHQKTIICHLGNGSSMVALMGTHPQDTSMGLTPTGGFMMGTRSGDLDPGVFLYLAKKYTRAQLEKLFDKESGLMGVSGISSDMRALLESSQKEATDAIDMFCYQVQKEIGAYIAALGGLDLLVFTGGIGENSKTIRKKIVKKLSFLSFKVKVIKTNEDLMIARHAYRLLS